MRVAILQIFALCPELVIAGYFQKHAHVRSCQAGKAEYANYGADDQNIQIARRNRNFAQLAIFAAGNKQNVKTLGQQIPFLRFVSRVKFDACSKLPENPVWFSLAFPLLGQGPNASPSQNQQKLNAANSLSQAAAALSSTRGVKKVARQR